MRNTIQIVLIVLLVVALAVTVSRELFRADPETPPVTDEAQIRDVLERFRAAIEAKDFEAVWDLTSKDARRDWGWSAAWIRGNHSESGPGKRMWEWLARTTGKSVEEIKALEPREFYLLYQAGSAREKPEEWRRQVTLLRSLEVKRIEIEGDGARIILPVPEDQVLELYFAREDRVWRFRGGMDDYEPLPWRSNEDKVTARLPLTFVHRNEVDVVIEVGPDGIDRPRAALLTYHVHRLLEGEEDPVVVLYPAEHTTWESVMFARDAIVLAGIRMVHFAFVTEERVAPGVRINGVALEKVGTGVPLGDPTRHTAAMQIIGDQQWLWHSRDHGDEEFPEPKERLR